jgi:hypothetical protein
LKYLNDKLKVAKSSESKQKLKSTLKVVTKRLAEANKVKVDPDIAAWKSDVNKMNQKLGELKDDHAAAKGYGVMYAMRPSWQNHPK